MMAIWHTGFWQGLMATATMPTMSLPGELVPMLTHSPWLARGLHVMQLLRLLQLVERGLQLRCSHCLRCPLIHQLVQIIREGAFLVVAVVHLCLDVQGGLGTWLRPWGQAAGGRPWGVT